MRDSPYYIDGYRWHDREAPPPRPQFLLYEGNKAFKHHADSIQVAGTEAGSPRSGRPPLELP